MYGFAYMKGEKNGYMNKGNWLGKYVHSMEHLGKMDSTTRWAPYQL